MIRVLLGAEARERLSSAFEKDYMERMLTL